MQSLDAPFQTGSSSAAPFSAAPAASPALASRASFGAASSSSLAGSASQTLDAPPSGTNTPAPLSTGSDLHLGAFGAAQNAVLLDATHPGATPPISHASDALSSSTGSFVAMDRSRSTAGSTWRANKGKGVAREGQVDADDPREQQRRIERVLQRAEASKLVRTFRNRIALASFKTQRGWQDVRLDTIEPHLEQEALKRSQPPSSVHNDAAMLHAAQMQQHDQLAYEFQAQQQAQEQTQLYAAQQHQQQSFDMDAVLAGLGGAPQHPHKRPRLDDGLASQSNLYSSHSVYAPPPQPTQTASPYSTAGVYQKNGALMQNPALALAATAGASPQPGPSRSGAGTPVLHDGSPAPTPGSASRRRGPSAAGAAGSPSSMSALEGTPRSRAMRAKRQSPGKPGTAGPGGQPLSSSDPNFSSFVDAATALTGMARAPSDPSIGSGSDEGGAAAGGAPHGAAPPRPSTPERQILKLPAGGGGNGPGSGGDGTAEGAAELMLYLAASPSPVQSRKTIPHATLGDGVGLKGRRLFSGVGGTDGHGSMAGEADASAVFGGELNGASTAATTAASTAALDAPFATASSASDPIKGVSSAPLVTPAMGSSGLLGMPATPGRQRQPSLNGGAGWESFLNTSPSPKRAARAASPPHGTIGGPAGEAQAAW
ncbi:Whi5 domain-containing protein [Rhodotorula paludigena]|uniref:Whi5 domain-containing protein n=1 Tax=Rhodotorula paludigena TaxID=86838 RepID=UPI0031764089